MTLDKILVTLLGITGIIFTYWFFLMRKETVVAAQDNIDILVKGGYKPDVISIPVGKPTTLHFLRQDPSTCLEEVIIPEFKVRQYLPMNKKTSITINPVKKGTYEIVCGMNMFHGKLIVT